tara:strand:- start:41219 stop:41839 length:621 start_codon:yes stop_codon:yes gene_type:complete
MGIPQAQCPNLWEIAAKKEVCDFTSFRTYLLHQISSPVSLYGYSMGARLALDFAVHHPEKVKKLVLFSVQPGLSEEDRAARKNLEDHWIQQLKTLDEKEFLAQWNAMPLFQGQANILAYPCDRSALIQALQIWGLSQQENHWQHLRSLPKNTYFVAGEHDSKFCAILDKIQQQSQHACHILPGQAHRIPFYYTANRDEWHWTDDET